METLESSITSMLAKFGVKGFKYQQQLILDCYSMSVNCCFHLNERQPADNTDMIKKKKKSKYTFFGIITLFSVVMGVDI